MRAVNYLTSGRLPIYAASLARTRLTLSGKPLVSVTDVQPQQLISADVAEVPCWAARAILPKLHQDGIVASAHRYHLHRYGSSIPVPDVTDIPPVSAVGIGGVDVPDAGQRVATGR